jgi:hypothetical protein
MICLDVMKTTKVSWCNHFSYIYMGGGSRLTGYEARNGIGYLGHAIVACT